MHIKSKKLGAVAPIVALLASSCVLCRQVRAEATAGEATYKAKCALCHGADGKGKGGALKTGDLAAAEVQKLSDAELTEIIANGKNKMPGYGKSLKPDQIKDLVAYVRSLARKS